MMSYYKTKKPSSWGGKGKGSWRWKNKPKYAYAGTVTIPRRKMGYLRAGGAYGRFKCGKELKFHDVKLDDASIAAGSTVTASINLIAQGTGESERNGRKCTIRKIQWRYRLASLLKASVNCSDTVRLIVYLDKQCNGATIAATDLLVPSGDYQGYFNLNNTSRFRTLFDKTISMNPNVAGNGTANDNATQTFNGTFFKDVNIPLEFDNTTGAITEIRSNNLGVLVVSNIGDFVELESRFRLRFEG